MKVHVYGGGLAGSEAAYQLLKRGVTVVMHEMKRLKKSPVHKMDTLCELVCSNSLKSEGKTSSGLLKSEMRILGSVVLESADAARVPAGSALAVDRNLFSQIVTDKLNSYPNFTYLDEIAEGFTPTGDDFAIVATGPLTDQALIPSLKKTFGDEFLYFFDAVAPIVTRESIDFESAFEQSRYGKGDADYVNCPMNKAEFEEFWQQLVTAETVEIKDFENNVFEGCMPIEVMAKRGKDTVRFGPLKPVGLYDEHKGERPYAAVQLRKENVEGTLYNLVGFQTHLKYGEQKRVFSLIPALKDAEFVRYGVMHRNTYVNSPKFLDANFRLRSNPHVYFAGQLTGVEGYVESAASGLVAGLSVYNSICGNADVDFTDKTEIGALCRHVSVDFGKYQPMNSNFGILAPLDEVVRDKTLRKEKMYDRSIEIMKEIVKNIKE